MYDISLTMHSYHRTEQPSNVLILLLHSVRCTDVIPPHTPCYPPPILLMSPLHSPKQAPLHWLYSPLYWCHSSKHIILSPTLLMLSLRGTEQPPVYWCFSHKHRFIPHCTVAIPLLYWKTHIVLNSLPSTNVIPLYTLCFLPSVLMISLHSTKHPPL